MSAVAVYHNSNKVVSIIYKNLRNCHFVASPSKVTGIHTERNSVGFNSKGPRKIKKEGFMAKKNDYTVNKK